MDDLSARQECRMQQVEWLEANLDGKSRLAKKLLRLLLVEWLLDDCEATAVLSQVLAELSYKPRPEPPSINRVIL